MNPDHSAEDRAKVDEYFRVIEERILAPIDTTDVRRSCTATLLLLFAAMDGLGHLLRPVYSKRSTDRIAFVLEQMGGVYEVHKKGLLNLRQGLVHHAVNVASFLSQTELDGDVPVKGVEGAIFVSTPVMCRDFATTFGRYRDGIERDPGLLKRAADRLEWREVNNPLEGRMGHGEAIPTPPPPVEFIATRRRRGPKMRECCKPDAKKD